jgi:ribose 1,5-bisphosphokinase PhnN
LEQRKNSNPKRGGGMHQLKEVDMLSTKMDLLMKRLDERAREKKEVMHIHDFRMTCEECGDTRHSGSNCPELQEDVNYLNNNSNYYHPQ